jgi:uncharacterized protein (TIGR01777 family)
VQELAEILEGVEVVINLAGAPIISRWTLESKKRLYESRILTTRKLADVIRFMQHPPRLLISGSAIGIYSTAGTHTEESIDLAHDFLGKVCRDWETEALSAAGSARVVIIRTGVVLGKGGGALKKMILPFRLGLGGPIASGKQGFSWIHLKDVLGAILFLIDESNLSGIFNLTSPDPIDNRTFSKILGHTLNMPAILPIPGFILRLMYGDGAIALTQGQIVYPQKLLASGYNFQFVELESALKDIIYS